MAAFGLGPSDQSVGVQDVDGVNLAAIEALEALKGKAERGDTLEAQAKLERLEGRSR